MTETKKISLLTIIIITFSVIIALLAAYILLVYELPSKKLAGQGTTIAVNDQIGGNFTLKDHNGDNFTSENLKGQLSLIYFGFTFCPDICPASLEKLSRVLSALEKYQIKVLPIFISVDPNRDNINILKNYLMYFSPKFIGLTGTEDEIKHVADLYKVYYNKVSSPNEVNDYMIDHTSFVYLLNKQGKCIKYFYSSSSADEIIEYIRIHKND